MTSDFYFRGPNTFQTVPSAKPQKNHFEIVKKGILIYLVLKVNVCMFFGIEILEGISNSTTSSGV
jgi:hypothetical protein